MDRISWNGILKPRHFLGGEYGGESNERERHGTPPKQLIKMKLCQPVVNNELIG
jgi:hypothetical protein